MSKRMEDTEMDRIRERRAQLTERLDAIRNAALGCEHGYLKEITDENGVLVEQKVDAMISKMLDAMKRYLASEKRELSEEMRQLYGDFLYCLLVGASPVRTEFLNSRGADCCTVDEEDPMENASWAPHNNETYQDLMDVMRMAFACVDPESLLLQEMGDDDKAAGLKWGGSDYRSFFRYMSLSLFWLKNERSFLPDYEGIAALPEDVREKWKQSYWNLLQSDRNPADEWLKRYSDKNIAKELKIGPQMYANTEEGLKERAKWAGYSDVEEYLKNCGFADKDSYMEYQTAFLEGQDKDLSREEVIALADRMIRARANTKDVQETPSLESQLREDYTDEMVERRKFKSFEDMLYARALEWLGRDEDAAAIRGVSAEDAQYLDMAAEVEEYIPTQEDEDYSNFVEAYADDFDENEAARQFEDMQEAEEKGIKAMEVAMKGWKETLPEAMQERLVQAYHRFRLEYSKHLNERAQLKEDFSWMMEVYLYEEGISAASTGMGYGFVLYQLERTPELVARQVKKARTLA